MTIQEIKKQEFKDIIYEIRNQSGVYVLEVENNSFNYITFVYEGYLYYIQASGYYPFTDRDFPGKWVYTVSQITGINEKAQITYFEEYTSFDAMKINRPHQRP